MPHPSETFLRRDGVHDDAELTVRPGPFGATREWRLLAGPERRPSRIERDAQSRRIAAWLELQFWWRLAFQAAARPRALYVPFLCVKLIAEPARLWLWLAEGRAVFSRRDVLREVLLRLPDEGDAFRVALELERALPRRPEPPLAIALASLTRLSTRLAALIADAVEEAGTMRVRLVGAGGRPLPLVDWRALVAPAREPESFALVDGDPADPALWGSARGWARGVRTTLRAPGLLVRPALGARGTKLRAVAAAIRSPSRSPNARDEAPFPELAGWSAADWTRRAVAEHRVWLEGSATPSANGYEVDRPSAGSDRDRRRDTQPVARGGPGRAVARRGRVIDGAPTLMLSLDAVVRSAWTSRTFRRCAEQSEGCARTGEARPARERDREARRRRTVAGVPRAQAAGLRLGAGHRAARAWAAG